MNWYADEQLDAMAVALNESGRFRVLRKLKPSASTSPPRGAKTRVGLIVDVETTGLDPTQDEVIELAMLPFTYGVDGQIYGVGEPFQRYREPSKPIPPAITAMTGISCETVAGQRIEEAEVTDFAQPASLVISHNAAFDRRFMERLASVFIEKPWACSMTEVGWTSEGFEGTKLAYLAMGAGFFYDKHRALHDCTAAIELLTSTLPNAGMSAMAAY